MKIKYSEIAQNYNLWSDYCDPSGLDTEEVFKSKSPEEKIDFLVACFGPEKQDAAE